MARNTANIHIALEDGIHVVVKRQGAGLPDAGLKMGDDWRNHLTPPNRVHAGD
jgi:hypothetical protein